MHNSVMKKNPTEHVHFCTPMHIHIYLQISIRFLDLSHKILTRFDQGMLTGKILIDLQKAFDTIDHEILLQKMKYLGFSDWIKYYDSYSANRIFSKVNVGDQFCIPGDLTCRVPQGSILGSLLFLPYINDMPLSLPLSLARSLTRSLTCYCWNNSIMIFIQYDLFIDNKLSVHFGVDKANPCLGPFRFCLPCMVPKQKSKN